MIRMLFDLDDGTKIMSSRTITWMYGSFGTKSFFLIFEAIHDEAE